VGLITGLLTLPLAPVRGTIWLAERLEEKAYEEMFDEGALQQALIELEAAREQGELSEDEAAEAEDELVERLMAIRGYREEEDHGGF
jgi:predicted Zn-dependent protease